MKNENTIGGTTLEVAPSVTSRHSSALRNSSHREAAAIVDAALIKEEEEDALAEAEEKFMIREEDDEEVTSMESNEMNHHNAEEDEDDPDVVVEQEDASLQVALMESVMKAHGGGGGASSCRSSSSSFAGGLKQRLRKSPRRSGLDLERLEQNQASLNGGLASRKRGRMVISSAVPNPLSDQPILPTATTTSSSINFDNSNTIPIKSVAFTGQGTTTKIFELAAPAKADFPIPVPCPLPAAAAIAESEPPDQLRKVNFCESVGTAGGPRFRGFSMDLDSKSLSPSSIMDCVCVCVCVYVCVHCWFVPEKKKKKNSKFSPWTHQSIHIARSFVVPVAVGLEMLCDDSSNAIVPLDASSGGGGRNRAFSFECFAFGINADEPLPPLEHSSTNHATTTTTTTMVGGRLRGDSIIFDPVSFRDGGIHEQRALEGVRSSSLEECEPAPVKAMTVSVPDPAPVLSTSMATTAAVSTNTTAKTSAAVDSTTATESSTSASTSGGVVPTTATISSTSTTTSTTTTSTTISMELLNKDGRIGIYLPEARRARIARFHAKRSNRVWRKRIKYDCRKKLADSRPRIKGRFVKRSDMDGFE
jgi:hypothetical protein